MSRIVGPRPFHPGTPWHLFRFEAPEASAPAAVAEPSAAPEAPAEVPAAQEWGGVSRDEWEGLQQQHAALLNWAQQQAAQAQQQQGRSEVPRPDPFADDFQEQLDRYIEAKTAPFQRTHEEMELAAGEELAHDIIADNIAREGDFLHEGSKERAFQLARSFMPQAVQRYGYTDRAGEAALELACKAVREWEDAVGKAYHERQTNQLATLAGARPEPGQAAPATQVQAGPYGRGQTVTERFFGAR